MIDNSRIYFLPSTNNYQTTNLSKTLRKWDTGLSQGLKEAQREKVQTEWSLGLGLFALSWLSP